MRCMGCGGVVGRDCFNPMECQQISWQMQQDSQYYEEQAYLLKQENERLMSLLIQHDIIREDESQS